MSTSLFDISGKNAIVTGGNGGIGLAIAEGFAANGVNLLIIGRNEEKNSLAISRLEKFGTNIFSLAADISQESEVKRVIDYANTGLNSVDILVNNAGINIRKPPQDFSVEEWDSVISVNLKSAFLMSQKVYPLMKQINGGKIINVGSMYSVFGSDWSAAYSSSKAGLVQLSKSLATSWAKDNIQVNTILPGWIKTDLTAPIESLFPDRFDIINRRIPIGRWGEPEDLIGVTIFLASFASNYLTGTSIPVDGGYSSF
ncbi:MAG: 2-deoxy-D-gluconate 3-dehydrogenase [Chloroflexi bacterium]|nr:2-deoxy-D-gluconate 3-dehydrogenase [Chloroflexota bacterium]|tara:strand:- start:2967 stop:3734 length:768 start_codon:yes stop_codon:yes gene_type:complete